MADARAKWVAHLGVDQEELCRFLDDLRFDTDASEATWRDRVVDVSIGLGLRADEAAIRAGVAEVREWVKTSRVGRMATDVEKAITRLKLRAAEPYGVLAIHAIDRDPATADATVVVDWVDRFEGDEARNRRQLRDAREWNEVLRLQLRQAAAQIKAAGYRRVLVRGCMRLPSWFTAGVYLGETAGFEVAARQAEELWSSHRGGDTVPLEIKTLDDVKFAGDGDLAVTLAVSSNLSGEVLEYLRAVPEAGRSVVLTTPTGPGGRAISGAQEAIESALGFRDKVRALALETRPARIHLFLAVPHCLALLLGHLWDRLPATQLYEDLGSGRGYDPSFLIPN